MVAILKSFMIFPPTRAMLVFSSFQKLEPEIEGQITVCEVHRVNPRPALNEDTSMMVPDDDANPELKVKSGTLNKANNCHKI